MKKVLSFLLSIIILLSVITPVFASKAGKTDNLTPYKMNAKVLADSYMLISLNDDFSYTIVSQKNQFKRKYPASLTKIATAMVTLNHINNLKTKTKVSKRAIAVLRGSGAQVAGLVPGETVTIEQLLYLCMIYSACDACQVLGEAVSGSIQAFVKEMNKWTKSIGCKNTHFVNPDGLHNKNHFSTSYDLMLMTLEALKDERFVKIANTVSYKFHGRTYYHTSHMLDKSDKKYYYKLAHGIKTGYTKQAGHCVITTASNSSQKYLAIVVDSPLINYTNCCYTDAKNMFNWAFKNLKKQVVFKANENVTNISVVNGKEADGVGIAAKDEVVAPMPAKYDKTKISIKITKLSVCVEAPVKKGDKVGEAQILYGNHVLGTTRLITNESVELSAFDKALDYISKKLHSSPKLFAAVIIPIIIVCVVIFNLIVRKKTKVTTKKVSEPESIVL